MASRASFHGILFRDPDGRARAERAAAPDVFADLNLDQIVAAVTAGKEEYDLRPFFHLPLRDADDVVWRQEIMQDLERPLGWSAYLAAPDFWNRTFQNWQSEFLAVASMVVFSIYLRERGSPESKPVGESHSATGVEG